jgi:hypothetical protein
MTVFSHFLAFYHLAGGDHVRQDLNKPEPRIQDAPSTANLACRFRRTD